MKASAPRLGTSLAYGRLVSFKEGEIALAFPMDAAFHRATVSGSGRTQIEAVLAVRLGGPTRLRIADPLATAEAPSPSPAEHDALKKASREKEIEARVRAHPAVAGVLRALGGQIENIQVLDADPGPPMEIPEEPA